jgi:hypothetical protein
MTVNDEKVRTLEAGSGTFQGIILVSVLETEENKERHRSGHLETGRNSKHVPTVSATPVCL